MEARKRKHTFRPNEKILQQAVDLTLKGFGISPETLKVNIQASNNKGLFSAHASNVGYPYYRNETKTLGNKTYRTIAYEKAIELLHKYGTSWIPAVPTTIIGRNQAGG